VGQAGSVQTVLASDGQDAGVYSLRMGEQLLADAGISAIGADQYVGDSGCAVGEVCGDPLVGADLVSLEGLAEAYDIVKIRQQHLTQADPARTVMCVSRAGSLHR
jgi:hypothetical protein